MPFKIVQKQVRGFFFLIQEVFGLILIDAREQSKYLLTLIKTHRISFLLEHWSKLSFIMLNNKIEQQIRCYTGSFIQNLKKEKLVLINDTCTFLTKME